MPRFGLLAVLLMGFLSFSAAAQQEQTARYDIVSGDRDIAWRLDRVTGEVLVCRVNPTAIDQATAVCQLAEIPAQLVGRAPAEEGTEPEQQQQQ